jgi:Bacterial archaeo-eukaryotic release factor family 3
MNRPVKDQIKKRGLQGLATVRPSSLITEKKVTLKPILESNKGVHFTAYLVNRGDLIDLKSQLRTVINESYEWLTNAMTIEERKKFLEPLDSLLNDARIFKQMKGNIGIFRNEDSFRILNIPIDVEMNCQIATSFHVKPLLRWLQGDQEFLFLGIEKYAAHLYLGSQSSFKKIDTVLFPDSFRTSENIEDYVSLKKARQSKLEAQETFSYLSDWILELTKQSKPKLFVAGDPRQTQLLYQNLKYTNAVKAPVCGTFINENAIESCHAIRKILKEDSRKHLEKSLQEFRFAEEGNRAKKNIFQISKAVVQGKVRKLIVTDEISIFGKIDPKTGGLAIHPFDLDHEDDCILDDLAQMVLKKGGEVVIAKRNEIPKGRPVLAVLDNEDPCLEKAEALKYDDLQERFG